MHSSSSQRCQKVSVGHKFDGLEKSAKKAETEFDTIRPQLKKPALDLDLKGLSALPPAIF